LKIIIAQSVGFCSGVKKAVELVSENLEGTSRLFSLGPLIHNKQVVKDLEEKGLVIQESIDNLAEGDIAVVRSHGVAEEVFTKLSEKGVKVIDATCAFVKKIHRIVNEHSSKEYPIIVIGQKDHPEVIGILGWCKSESFVISDVSQIKDLPEFSKACVVAQTTLDFNLWGDIIKKLSFKIESLQIFNTICNSTIERQDEAKEISKIANKMVVVGDSNSSNTKKLFDICKNSCTDTYLVENAVQLDNVNFNNDDIIGIVAGASTPENQINEINEKLKLLEGGGEKKVEIVSEKINSEKDFEKDQNEESCVLESQTQSSDEMSKQHKTGDSYAETQEDKDVDNDDMNSMADFHKTMVVLRGGEIVKGTVISVSSKDVIVNLGYKSDGILSADEMKLETFKVGDVGEFEILKVNDGDGNVILSRKSIEKRLAWDSIEKSLEQGTEIQGVCTEVVKGGVIATLFSSIGAFVPASQLTTHFVSDLSTFVGTTMRLKVIEIDRRRNRVVASQRIILEGERNLKRSSMINSLVEGQRVEGVVMRLTDFGVFVDIGGVDGLIRMPDLSWFYVKHPKEVLKEGQKIETVILSINKEKEKISLGYKQISSHPWDNITSRYKVGDVVEGKVARIVAFGAFVELEPGVDGLVHISQISTQRVAVIEKVIQIGQIVKAKVISVDEVQKKISLSIKEAEENIETSMVSVDTEEKIDKND